MPWWTSLEIETRFNPLVDIIPSTRDADVVTLCQREIRGFEWTARHAGREDETTNCGGYRKIAKSRFLFGVGQPIDRLWTLGFPPWLPVSTTVLAASLVS